MGGREWREEREVVGRGACVTVSQSGIQSESQRGKVAESVLVTV